MTEISDRNVVQQKKGMYFNTPEWAQVDPLGTKFFENRQRGLDLNNL